MIYAELLHDTLHYDTIREGIGLTSPCLYLSLILYILITHPENGIHIIRKSALYRNKLNNSALMNGERCRMIVIVKFRIVSHRYWTPSMCMCVRACAAVCMCVCVCILICKICIKSSLLTNHLPRRSFTSITTLPVPICL